MNRRDTLWIIKLGDRYLKHPSGPQVTKDPQDAYGCHYKSDALKYLKEFIYLVKDNDGTVLRRYNAIC